MDGEIWVDPTALVVVATMDGSVVVGIGDEVDFCDLVRRPSAPVIRSNVLPAPMCVRRRSLPKNRVELERTSVWV